MDKQIIEIANDGLFLSVTRGFCSITDKDDQVLANVALDDILSLVVSANDMIISKNIINAIIENSGTIIFCGKNYMPTSIILPYVSHWQSGERIRKQIAASSSLQKNLCKTLIQHKIKNQALVLEWLNPDSDKIERLKHLAKTVKSGDTANNEATAAQIYFKEIFGKHFIRDRKSDDINLLLNYIYIVLRACVARAVAGAGLLPAIGVLHSNKLNPFTLVDDLMEPYRPLADFIVFQVLQDIEVKNNLQLTPEIKRNLAAIISVNLENNQGLKPLATSLFDTANSLAKSYVEKKNLLEIDNYISNNDLIK